jgi:hypothetical protein
MSLLRIGIVAVLLGPVFASASMSIRFENDGVVASGVTRGGKVIAASFERLPVREQRAANRVLVDDDHDGAVRIAMDERAASRSVWIFVDFQSGEYAASMPDGVIARLDFRGGGLKDDAPGQLHRLLHKSGNRLQLVVVRPNEGAWALEAADGGAADRDHKHDGVLEADLEDFRPLRGSGQAPKNFRKDDVVVGIDPYSLRVFALKVGK